MCLAGSMEQAASIPVTWLTSGRWTRKQATGRGTVSIDDCTPGCADGTLIAHRDQGDCVSPCQRSHHALDAALQAPRKAPPRQTRHTTQRRLLELLHRRRLGRRGSPRQKPSDQGIRGTPNGIRTRAAALKEGSAGHSYLLVCQQTNRQQDRSCRAVPAQYAPCRFLLARIWHGGRMNVASERPGTTVN